MHNKPQLFTDSYIMFRRSFTKMLRSPETMIMATLVPVAMMTLFGFVFGGITDLGDINYLDFIVPALILQCVANASSTTGMGVYQDLSTGIIDRFRTMPIAKSAFLAGHVAVSLIRNAIIAAVTVGAGLAIGFRPSAGPVEWLIVTGILLLFILAITWIVVIFGLMVKDAEALSGISFLLTMFTFLSSGFAPTDTLPTALRIFAEHQPMTPIIDSLRALMLGFPLGNEIWIALAWCVGMIIGAFIIALRIYKKKLTQ